MTPEYLIERKKHKNEIKKWKIAAIFISALAIFLGIKSLGVIPSGKAPSRDYIASILIDDILFEDPKRDSRLEKIIDDEEIKALIVHVNSPGGTLVGADKIYKNLRKIAEKKPVVTVMGTMATSGGYLVSLGGDYIISHIGTITGSIGVIFQTAEVTELAERMGIKFNNFKSGELKAVPNPTEKVSEAVREVVMSIIEDSYNYFIELVAIRRGFSIEETKKIADGRVYSGRQALQLRLVDAIGAEEDAVKWLQENKQIDAKLKVKEFKLKPEHKIIEMFFEVLGTALPTMLKGQFRSLMAIF